MLKIIISATKPCEAVLSAEKRLLGVPQILYIYHYLRIPFLQFFLSLRDSVSLSIFTGVASHEECRMSTQIFGTALSRSDFSVNIVIFSSRFLKISLNVSTPWIWGRLLVLFCPWANMFCTYLLLVFVCRDPHCDWHYSLRPQKKKIVAKSFKEWLWLMVKHVTNRSYV